MAISRLFTRVDIFLFELSAQFSVFFIGLLQLLLRHLQVDLQRVGLICRYGQLLVELLDELVLDRSGLEALRRGHVSL